MSLEIESTESPLFREHCPITGDCCFKPVQELRRFPVRIGCVSSQKSADLFADLDICLSLPSAVVQIRNLQPLSEVYACGHGSGSIGALWRRHHESFADFIAEDIPSVVMEIGGGHGHLACAFLDRYTGCKEWTIVDPNPPTPSTLHPEINIVRDFFKADLECKKSTTIVHSHTLEHMYDPLAFFKNLNAALAVGDAQVFSVPHMESAFRNGDANCINFEHTILLDRELIQRLADVAGFEITKSGTFEEHSLFYRLTKVREIYNKSRRVEIESNKRLEYIHSLCDEFRANSTFDVDIFFRELQEFPNSKVFLFGGHIFTQRLLASGIPEDCVSAILDNDPAKQGMRLYGYGLQIVSPEIIRDLYSPIVVVRASTYTAEIIQQLREINPTVRILR